MHWNIHVPVLERHQMRWAANTQTVSLEFTQTCDKCVCTTTTVNSTNEECLGRSTNNAHAHICQTQRATENQCVLFTVSFDSNNWWLQSERGTLYRSIKSKTFDWKRNKFNAVVWLLFMLQFQTEHDGKRNALFDLGLSSSTEICITCNVVFLFNAFPEIVHKVDYNNRFQCFPFSRDFMLNSNNNETEAWQRKLHFYS